MTCTAVVVEGVPALDFLDIVFTELSRTNKEQRSPRMWRKCVGRRVKPPFHPAPRFNATRYRFSTSSSSSSSYKSPLSKKAEARLQEAYGEHESIEKRLHSEECETLRPDEIGKLSEKLKRLSAVAEHFQQVLDKRKEVGEFRDILSDSSPDPDLAEIAREELPSAESSLLELETEALDLILPKDELDERSVILELRAGTGGTEAALFTSDLAKMYQAYASTQNWKATVMNTNFADLGGVKEMSVRVRGDNAFSILKHESGVHRVQRIPQTDKAGRIHTSAMTVMVLPEATEVDTRDLVKSTDLRIDTYRAQGAGGQHVNTTDSAVRITHIPSGVVVQCQDERSQHKNKAAAMTMLHTKLFAAKVAKHREEQQNVRQQQVSSGDRSDRIRTYNWPQDRVTDHRIPLTVTGIEKMLRGEYIGRFADELSKQERLEALKSL